VHWTAKVSAGRILGPVAVGVRAGLSCAALPTVRARPKPGALLRRRANSRSRKRATTGNPMRGAKAVCLRAKNRPILAREICERRLDACDLPSGAHCTDGGDKSCVRSTAFKKIGAWLAPRGVVVPGPGRIAGLAEARAPCAARLPAARLQGNPDGLRSSTRRRGRALFLSSESFLLRAARAIGDVGPCSIAWPPRKSHRGSSQCFPDDSCEILPRDPQPEPAFFARPDARLNAEDAPAILTATDPRDPALVGG